MRFAYWRGAALGLALAGLMGTLGASSARARDWFDGFKTIPREVPAVDFRTGAPMQAPPIPYGHYVKDPAGTVHQGIGMAAGAVHHLKGAAAHLGDGIHNLCGACGGKGCGNCGGSGLGGPSSGCGNTGCTACAGKGGSYGPGTVMKTGLFGKHGGGPLSGYPSNAIIGNGGMPTGYHTHGGVPCGGRHGVPCASPQSPYPTSHVAPLAPCKHGLGKPGCGLCGGLGGGKHGGMIQTNGGGCGLGNGCGLGGGCGGAPAMRACGSCGGKGCGLCGGKGGLCGHCGGAGCGLCGALAGKAHGLLGAAHGVVAKAFHIGDIKYFVGPGGPVPLTPGYVPYVVPTRSPRDYFAFPPFGNGVAPDY